MTPEISEFSYGFALTNELVGWLELSAAPVLPSLIEEGKDGGGYDLKLDRPGAPLFLQFKRSECMTRRSATEYRKVRDLGGALGVPFYRFPITERRKSRQHEMLLALDSPPNLVFYVAPRFHRLDEINDAWHTHTVAGRSIFVAPQEIGSLDNEKHSVAFDASRHWLCSDPREIRALSARELAEKIQHLLSADERPMRERIPSMVEELRDAERRGRTRILEREAEAELQAEIRRAERFRESPDIRRAVEMGLTLQAPTRSERRAVDARRALEAPEPRPPSVKAAEPLSPEAQALREAADIAAHVFDTQLVIVQPAD